MPDRSTLESIIERFRDGARVVILGVGNPDLAWDAVGGALARDLERRLRRFKRPRLAPRFLHTGTMPENFIGPVRRLEPDHVLLFDAADFGGAFAEPRLFTDAELDRATVSCHKLPFSLFARMLRQGDKETPTLHVVGFQTREGGSGDAPEYRACLERLVRLFVK